MNSTVSNIINKQNNCSNINKRIKLYSNKPATANPVSRAIRAGSNSAWQDDIYMTNQNRNDAGKLNQNSSSKQKAIYQKFMDYENKRQADVHTENKFLTQSN